MKLLTSKSAADLTAAGLRPAVVTLPRVNLLPPEHAERRRFRRIQYGLGGAVLGMVAVVAAGFVLASGAVGARQADVDNVNGESVRLQAESGKYASVTAAYAQAAAAQGMLTQAMGNEVRYSRLLSDLSLSIPHDVWLTQLTFAETPATSAAATTPGVGSLTVTGRGFSHEDVAVWLESLSGQKAFANPYFSSSTERLLGTRKIVDFSSTATLTNDALSGRYTKPAGG